MKVEISKFVDAVINNCREKERYEAYRYCKSYFSNEPINLEVGCLQLWSYLASWGMLRGSSNLLQCHSYKSLQPMIEKIADWKSEKPEYWEIDVSNYKETKVNLKSIYDEVKRMIEEIGTAEHKSNVTATDTLITKIMLGVWGAIPAIDVNFREFLPKGKKSNIETIIDYLSEFYEANKIEIDSLAKDHGYTKAKIVDMYGFAYGDDIIKKRQSEKNKITEINQNTSGVRI